MARSFFALPIAGLLPGDPTLTPGLALTPTQQTGLTTALRHAPSPAVLLQELRQALERREPIARILERLRASNQVAAVRPYALRVPPEETVAEQTTRPGYAPSAQPTPRPAT